MPTTIASLYDYNPVRNPVRVAVSGDYFITAGQVGTARITFNGSDMPADGDTLTIAVATLGIEEVFTFRTTPAQVNDITAYSSGDVNTWISSTLVPAVRANYHIGTLFDVTSSPLTMRVAPRAGTAYPAVITADGFTPTDIIYSPDNIPPVTQEEYSAVLQVWSEPSAANGTYLLRSEEDYQPNSAGQVTVPIEDILRTYLAPAVPTLEGGITLNAASTHARFYIRAGERYGDPIVVRPMVTSPVKWAYLAGRAELQRTTFPNWDTEIFGSPTVIKFLSIWPNTDQRYPKLVAPGQPEFLSFIFPDNRGSVFNLRADLYWETGSATTAHLVQAFTGQDFRNIIVHAGFTKLALEAVDPTRRLAGYRLYITNSGVSLRSEYRYFRIDRRYRQSRRYLVYWTSAGGLDTLVLHGQRQAEGKVKLNTSNTISTGMRDVNERLDSMDQEYQQGTAHLSQAELPALIELQGSEQRHEYDGAVWRPVQLVGMRDLALDREDNGLESRSIAYRYAATDRAASRR
jgi:hypothetical protein